MKEPVIELVMTAAASSRDAPILSHAQNDLLSRINIHNFSDCSLFSKDSSGGKKLKRKEK